MAAVTVIAPNTFGVSTQTGAAVSIPEGTASIAGLLVMNDVDVLSTNPLLRLDIGIGISTDDGATFPILGSSQWESGPGNTDPDNGDTVVPSASTSMRSGATMATIAIGVAQSTYFEAQIAFMDASGNIL
jgi:hypothetical protein